MADHVQPSNDLKATAVCVAMRIVESVMPVPTAMTEEKAKQMGDLVAQIAQKIVHTVK